MTFDREPSYPPRRALSRRRVLRGTAAGALGLGLAGCGTGPSSETTSGGTVVATVAPTPTTAPASPKYGGELKTIATFSERALDPHVSSGAAGGIGAAVCYSQLLTYKWGPDVKRPSYIAAGDLAESWTHLDETTFLFKLRTGIKFLNLPPVNGRELDAEDAARSFRRILDKRTFAASLAGVSDFEVVDPRTLRLRLEKPNADLLGNLAVANLSIVARELAEQDLATGPTIGPTVARFPATPRPAACGGGRSGWSRPQAEIRATWSNCCTTSGSFSPPSVTS
jgi:peptide/nickel transport system substrate-binding protein